jgi:hypothetical protein
VEESFQLIADLAETHRNDLENDTDTIIPWCKKICPDYLERGFLMGVQTAIKKQSIFCMGTEEPVWMNWSGMT